MGSLGATEATKSVSINNQQCMVKPALIDLNVDELHYYTFMISMQSYDESCNTAECKL